MVDAGLFFHYSFFNSVLEIQKASMLKCLYVSLTTILNIVMLDGLWEIYKNNKVWLIGSRSIS